MAWTNKVIDSDIGKEFEILSIGSDITKQKVAEDKLDEYRLHLENLVEQRTTELSESNEKLHQEAIRRKNTIRELQQALGEVKTLQGILPICAQCKKIRDDKGYWQQVEKYIQDRSNAEFSHGLCKDCLDELYGGQDWYQKRGKK